MKIAVICDTTRFSSRLQAWGARLIGRPAHPALPYHVAWTDGTHMWDMNTKFRKIPADHYASRNVILFESPVEITPEYLDSMVGKRSYGYLDVALYPLFQLIGLNWWGTHCSEAINDDLWFHGCRTPWIPYGAPPTPADMLYWAEETLRAA